MEVEDEFTSEDIAGAELELEVNCNKGEKRFLVREGRAPPRRFVRVFEMEATIVITWHWVCSLPLRLAMINSDGSCYALTFWGFEANDSSTGFWKAMTMLLLPV